MPIVFKRKPVDEETQQYWAEKDRMWLTMHVEETNWSDLLTRFYDFLRGCGYNIKPEDFFVEEAFEASVKEIKSDNEQYYTTILKNIQQCRNIREVRNIIDATGLLDEET